MGLDTQIYRGIGTAGVGGSFGFMQFVGKGYFVSDGAFERSTDTTVFNILPLSLVAFYRFDYLVDLINLPIVPYLRGGLAYHVWWVTNGVGEISRISQGSGEDIVGRGGKLGVTGTAGVSLLLNFFEPAAAASLHEAWGIRGTYIFAEIVTTQVDDFGGEGFDLSDQTYNLGMYIEF